MCARRPSSLSDGSAIRAASCHSRRQRPREAVTIQAAPLWADGRNADRGAASILERALGDPRPEIQALACLGLGRHADARTVALLARLAADAARPGELRIAATLALGRAEGPQAAAALVSILDRGDGELSRAAALALAWTRHPRALPALLARALLPAEFALASSEGPLAALAFWQAGEPPPDEARSIVGSDLSLPAMLAALLETAPAEDLTPLLRAHTGEIDAILSDALRRGGSARRAALESLDARPDALTLGGPGADGGGAASAPATAGAAREIAWPLADGIALALDDPDRRTRALALRVLAKLDDERLTPAQIAEAIVDGAPVLTGAALSATQDPRPGPSGSGRADRRPRWPHSRPTRWLPGLLELPARGGGAAARVAGPARLAGARSCGQRPQHLVRSAALEAVDRAGNPRERSKKDARRPPRS